jgi:hypothetical protein
MAVTLCAKLRWLTVVTIASVPEYFWIPALSIVGLKPVSASRVKLLAMTRSSWMALSVATRMTSPEFALSMQA